MIINSINLDGKLYTFGEDSGLEIDMYEGREITEYSWTELLQKILNNDLLDLRVGDWKSLTLNNGEVVEMQIAGIDTYYGSYAYTSNGNNANLYHHIDWISKNCLNSTYVWDSTGKSAAGTNRDSIFQQKQGATGTPIIQADLWYDLNNIYTTLLPDEVQHIILNKYIYSEVARSKDMIDSKTTGIFSPGYLWLPTECEVFGCALWGTDKISDVQQTQYPLFKFRPRTRLKKSNGSPISWWLNTPASGDNTTVCCVHANGYACHEAADTSLGVPLCFRIGGMI
jgi:hypothetical protein